MREIGANVIVSAPAEWYTCAEARARNSKTTDGEGRFGYRCRETFRGFIEIGVAGGRRRGNRPRGLLSAAHQASSIPCRTTIMGNQIVHLLADATLRKQNMRGGHSRAAPIHHIVGSPSSLRLHEVLSDNPQRGSSAELHVVCELWNKIMRALLTR